jgi:enoyl-CoA hydratase/carnithine racemase
LATVVINRPESLNTLSVRVLQELTHVAGEMAEDPTLRVVILTGAGDNFSAGMDLKDPDVKNMVSGHMAQRRQQVVWGPRACRTWEETGPVTIAAIEGYCIGGGVSLAVSCDFRIMAQSAYLRIPEIELGLNYSWGSIPRLVHLAGPARTKQMILLAEKVPADTCHAWGLTEQVVPDGTALDAAGHMAEKILQKPPIPVAMTKQAVTAVTAASDRAGIYMDADQFLLTTYSEDHREGVNAFLEKRKPRFQGK